MKCDSRRRSSVDRCLLRAGLQIILACFITIPPAMAVPPPGYRLVWSDEFNQAIGAKPSSAHWNFETADVGKYNNELEVYVDDVTHAHIVADPQAVDGRALQILATSGSGKPGTVGAYKSARIDSNGHYVPQYGFIEARIKLPYGKGIWPAFWMLGKDINPVGWPKCGEADIMENIGVKQWEGLNQGSLHSPGHSADNSLHAVYTLPDDSKFKDGYHLFQVLWLPNSMSFYVDGNLYQTRTPADTGVDPWPFNAPFYFLINVAVGGNWPGSPDASTRFPQKMLIDYVRVYSGALKAPSAPAHFQAARGPDGDQSMLAWTGATGATSYRIYRGGVSAKESGTPLATVTATSYIDQNLTAGKKYFYKVVAINPSGNSAPSPEVVVKTTAPKESPYGGKPWPIPGQIDFENYDNGGEGIGYHDKNTTNIGGLYRSGEHVSIAATQDVTGRYDVGYNSSGNWLKFTVNVAKPGIYKVGFRVASGSQGGTLHLENAQGVNLTGTVPIPSTNGWETWTTVYATAKLSEGTQVIKLVEDNAGYNLNYMTFAGNYSR